MRKILFFDTETSGLPKNYKASMTDTSNWPRIVQLAWIAAQEDGAIIKRSNSLIKPDGFTISEEAAKVHGHTLEKLNESGWPIGVVLAEIMLDIQGADLIVCHNLGFDYPVLACEFIRDGVKSGTRKATYCTMQSTTNLCKIPGPYGYKWPKLQELHKHLFGCEFDGAHDAMADIEATVKCYFRLKEIGHHVPI